MKPARCAVCHTKSDIATLLRRMERASLVDRNRCGWTITARTARGTGICLTWGLSMPTVSTRPPNSEGAMLSTCMEPEATASPCMANFSSSSLLQGLGSSALAATTAATAEAAEPPRPDPSGMPFSIRMSKPKGRSSACCRASTARPAVLPSGLRGRSTLTPVMLEMVRPRSRGARDRHLVTQRIDRKPQDVEANGHIAGRGRRKGRGGGRSVQICAPR